MKSPVADVTLVNESAEVIGQPDRPRLLYLRRWRTTTSQLRDVFEPIAWRHADASRERALQLIAWLDLPEPQSGWFVDVDWSEHTSFDDDIIVTRAIVRLGDAALAAAVRGTA
jgi:hypothetical protein